VIDHDTSLLLGRLVLGHSVASLATLHDGRPFASMIPYAVLVTGRDPHADDDGGDNAGSVVFVSHVSRLSAHTRDMLATPEVCLLVTAPESTDSSGPPPQALPRVSLPAQATFIDAAHPAYEALKQAYLGRSPCGRLVSTRRLLNRRFRADIGPLHRRIRPRHDPLAPTAPCCRGRRRRWALSSLPRRLLHSRDALIHGPRIDGAPRHCPSWQQK
jgi:hypothetical protein